MRQRKEREMKNKTFTVLVLLLLVATAALSQEIKTDTSRLEAAALQKETGKFIAGLGKDDFLLYERGRRMDIVACSEIEAPLSLVLLIDVSGSMKDIMKPTIEAALVLVKSLKPEDEVAIIAFAKSAELVEDFTLDKQIIEDRIKKIDEAVKLERIGTQLDDAMLQAVTQLGKATVSNSRRVVIAITDNFAPRYPDRPRKEALGELSRSGGIVCGLVTPRTLDGRYYNPPLKEIAERMHADPSSRPLTYGTRREPDGSLEIYTKATGGFAFDLKGEQIEAKIVALVDVVRKYYLIEYKSPGRVVNVREIKLKMLKEAEKREGAAKLIVQQKAQSQ